MSRFSIARPARQDLKEIHRYVARDKPGAARRLRQTLEGTFRLLARNPMIGEARPDLGDDVRMFSVGSYVIFFRPAKSGIVIVRVIHGARNVASLWRPD